MLDRIGKWHLTVVILSSFGIKTESYPAICELYLIQQV